MPFLPTSIQKLDRILQQTKKDKEEVRDLAGRCWHPMDKRELEEAARHLYEAEERLARVIDRRSV